MIPYRFSPGDTKYFCAQCEVASTDAECWICGGSTEPRLVYLINAYNHDETQK